MLNRPDSRWSLRINYRELVRKRIPVVAWLPNYTLIQFFSDLLAGFTVGLTEIPQGIAYAKVAGLSPEYGLYSGFMGCFMYFIFGSTKDVNIGPTAIMALMVQDHVDKMGPDMAVLICFLSGCIIFGLGLLQLGFLIELFSYPVIAGFTSAAALNIASSQINSLLGIPLKSNAFLEAFQQLFQHFGDVKKWDVTLGLLTMVFLFASKEIRRYGSINHRPEWSGTRNFFAKCIFLFSISRNAIAVIVGSVIAYSFERSTGKIPFAITGVVNAGLPPFEPPPFSTTFNGKYYSFSDMISNFGGIVAFCPLIALLEHMAISKAFTKGKTLDATQEMLALGISNVMSSFVRSMPITGSFTRTAVNNASGVRTTAGGIVSGTMVLLALGFLTTTFTYIPKASLAAVVMVSMFYLFEFEAFPLLWRSKKSDLIPFLVTLGFCLFLSLEYGILIGIGTNLTYVLYTSVRPKLLITKEKLPQGDVYVVTPKTGLHFTAAEYLRDTVLQDCFIAETSVVINGGNIGNIDATVAKCMNELASELKLRGQNIIFWNFKKNLVEICLGINGDLGQLFRDGEQLRDIIQISPITPSAPLSDVSSIQ